MFDEIWQSLYPDGLCHDKLVDAFLFLARTHTAVSWQPIRFACPLGREHCRYIPWYTHTHTQLTYTEVVPVHIHIHITRHAYTREYVRTYTLLLAPEPGLQTTCENVMRKCSTKRRVIQSRNSNCWRFQEQQAHPATANRRWRPARPPALRFRPPSVWRGGGTTGNLSPHG